MIECALIFSQKIMSIACENLESRQRLGVPILVGIDLADLCNVSVGPVEAVFFQSKLKYLAFFAVFTSYEFPVFFKGFLKKNRKLVRGENDEKRQKLRNFWASQQKNGRKFHKK
jgi:hypothetical protein